MVAPPLCLFCDRITANSMTVKERVLASAETPASVLDVNGLGPCAAVGRLTPRGGEGSRGKISAEGSRGKISCHAEGSRGKISVIKRGRRPYPAAVLRPETVYVKTVTVYVRAVLCYFAGLKNWFEFSELRYGEDVFPPDLGGILEWSNTFRCVGTFVNYAGYVRTACIALDMPYVKNSHPAMQRAKLSVVKRMMFTSRCCAPRCFLSNEAVLRNCTCLW